MDKTTLKEHIKLGIFVGEWETSGSVFATETSQAVAISGTDVYEWLPGGFFLLHRVKATMGNVGTESTEIIGWNAKEQLFLVRSFDAFGNCEEYLMDLCSGFLSFRSTELRFRGAFSEDKQELSGIWEKDDGVGWYPQMETRLIRR